MDTEPKEIQLEEVVAANDALKLSFDTTTIVNNTPVYIPTEESRKLLAQLNSSRIRFAHWKSNSHLLRSLAGKTDLDLLIHPDDRGTFEASMLQLGYKRIASQPWCSYPGVDDWLGMDYETGSFLHIHAHYALVTGVQHVKQLRLPWIEVLFKNIERHENTGWPIPRRELEALILLVRISAKMPLVERLKTNPEIPHYIVSELLDLLNRSDVKIIKALALELNLMLPKGFETAIQRICESGSKEEILCLSQFLYKQLKTHHRSPLLVTLCISLYHKLALKLRKYAVRYCGPISLGKKLVQEGKVFALIGSDGSGKSTLSNDLIEWLSYKLDPHYMYMGKNPYIKSYNKKILHFSDPLFSNNKLSKKVKKLLGETYYVALINKKIRLLGTAKKLRSTGSVVLCDRFPQQQINRINDGPYLQDAGFTWSSRAEKKGFDQVRQLEADVVFKLMVTPEVAASRKPEHNPHIIKEKCAYINQAKFDHAAVVEVDANMSYDQVLLTIKREIWKHLSTEKPAKSEVKIIEMLGPPGVGKSTIYKSICKEWNPAMNWIHQDALLAPPMPSVVNLVDWVEFNLRLVLSKKRAKSIPIDFGLRFINNNIKLANLCWEHLSTSTTPVNSELDKRFKSAYFLFSDFCRYQAIMESNSYRPCLIDEGLFQKSFLLSENEVELQNLLEYYLSLTPLPHAILFVQLNSKTILEERLKSRGKTNALHKGKTIEELRADIKKWQVMLEALLLKLEQRRVKVYRLNAELPIADNIQKVIEILKHL